MSFLRSHWGLQELPPQSRRKAPAHCGSVHRAPLRTSQALVTMAFWGHHEMRRLSANAARPGLDINDSFRHAPTTNCHRLPRRLPTSRR
eukprot:15291466-Alexandrium_andersonii.AAC.1